MDWIVTSNVAQETWRRLKEFANSDIAFDAIAQLHGQPEDQRLAENYRKQAAQLRLCILQAEEYFEASSSATLYTKPTLIYYGLVALASAVMLLLGDGDRSFDRLRKNPKNRSHGLHFTIDLTQRDASKGLSLLEQSRVEVLAHGHFANWYSVLPGQYLVPACITRTFGSSRNINYELIGNEKLLTLNEIVGRKWSLCELTRHLPDLIASIHRYGVDVLHTRVNHDVEIDEGNGDMRHTWRLHGAGSAARLDRILEEFKFSGSLIERVTWSDPVDVGRIVTLNFKKGVAGQFVWPSIRYTADLRGYMLPNAERTHEFVDMYLLAFGLSMAARYYPDLWVSSIDSHCRAAKLAEASIEVISTKAPILALSFLRGEPIFMASYRAPWHD